MTVRSSRLTKEQRVMTSLEDVTYGKLEEMTAKADGKMTAEEDPQAAFSSRKVMD